jgi:hypothetical protein
MKFFCLKFGLDFQHAIFLSFYVLFFKLKPLPRHFDFVNRSLKLLLLFYLLFSRGDNKQQGEATSQFAQLLLPELPPAACREC